MKCLVFLWVLAIVSIIVCVITGRKADSKSNWYGVIADTFLIIATFSLAIVAIILLSLF